MIVFSPLRGALAPRLADSPLERRTDQAAQFHHAPPDTGFDRAQRFVQLLGYFVLGESAEICHFDDFALVRA